MCGAALAGRASCGWRCAVGMTEQVRLSVGGLVSLVALCGGHVVWAALCRGYCG